MGKKANPTPAPPVEPVAEPAPKTDAPVEPVAAEIANGNVAVIDTPVVLEAPVVAPPSPKVAVSSTPAVDDDMAYAIQVMKEQLIKSVDPSLKDKFWAENEGKSLKQKAAWIAANKVIAAPDPAKGLPKGPAGGEKPFSVVDFSNSLVNKRK